MRWWYSSGDIGGSPKPYLIMNRGWIRGSASPSSSGYLLRSSLRASVVAGWPGQCWLIHPSKCIRTRAWASASTTPVRAFSTVSTSPSSACVSASGAADCMSSSTSRFVAAPTSNGGRFLSQSSLSVPVAPFSLVTAWIESRWRMGTNASAHASRIGRPEAGACTT